ncbi:hypothetical protein ACWE42_20210 [Sutcliffiella cohnii]
MKQLKRIFFLLAAMVVFFMSNSVPLVALANSWTPAPLTPGNWEVDPWKVDDWTPPTLNTSELNTPELNTPQLSNPEWQIPLWNTQEWSIPPWAVGPLNPDNITPPEWNPSDQSSLNEWGVHPLTVQVWEVEMGTPTNPYPVLQFQWWLENQLTDPSLSHLNLGEHTTNQTLGENSLTSPQVTDGRSSPLDSLTGYDPYGQQFTTYDGLKFTINDTALGLVSFTTGMLEAEMNGVSPGRGFVTSGGLHSILVNSVKTVGSGTGNPWVQGTGDVLDGALKTAQSIEGLNNVRTAIDSINQSWQGSARLGDSKFKTLFSNTSGGAVSTLSKFNIATGVIGAGFSGYESYQNIKAWNNETDFTKKTDLAGKSATSIGNTLLSGGAALASVPIPGLQVVGGALIVTGGALAIGGMALQWANKTETGRKIIAGTVNTAKKIGRGIKKLFGK